MVSWFGVLPRFFFPFFWGCFVVSSLVVPVSFVARSARRAGAVSVSAGSSVRAFSGFACRPAFPSAALAAEFAACWAGVVGVVCLVRVVPVADLFGGVFVSFVVSVPVSGGAL